MDSLLTDNVSTITQQGNVTSPDPPWSSLWSALCPESQRTAVVAGPGFLLWPVAALYSRLLTTRPDIAPAHLSLLRIREGLSKLLAMLLTFELAVHVLDQGFVSSTTSPAVLAPAILLSAVILSVELGRLEHRKGLRSSLVLCVFWLALAVSHVMMPFIGGVQKSGHEGLDSVLLWSRLAVVVCLFVLGMQARAPEEEEEPPGIRRHCPEPMASLWSRLTFSWVKELLVKGRGQTLTEVDIYRLLPSETSSHVTPKVQQAWSREVDRLRERAKIHETCHDTEEQAGAFPLPRKMPSTTVRKRTQWEENGTPRVMLDNRSNGCFPGESDTKKRKDSDTLPTDPEWTTKPEDKSKLEDEVKDRSEGQRSTPKPRFWRVLLATFGLEFFFQQLFEMVNLLLHMSQPLLLGLLLEFTEDKTAPVGQGYLVCGAMMLCLTVRTFLSTRITYLNHRFSIRVRSAIVNSVYRKILTMDNESRQKSTVGQAVNLMSVDAGDICHALSDKATEMWQAPIYILMSLVMLYRLLGNALWISVILIASFVPFVLVVVRRLSKMHDRLMEQKDDRLKIFTEVINSIKILKMYAWEPSFIDKVNAARDKELDTMRKKVFYETAEEFLWDISPYLVSVMTLMTYVYMSEDHYLSPSKAFVAISFLDILKEHTTVCPDIIVQLIKVTVSFRRVNSFLNRTDLDTNASDDENADPDSDDAITIRNGSFAWTSGSAPVLKKINMSVKKGSLVAVVGTVGCGKSSLLSACLGEMKKLKGHVSVKGSVAYVPQQAWIQHATLKNNVLFGQNIHPDLYCQSLRHCALLPDLNTLPDGDRTEIGEKGINISGGQKQRVSLARAVCNQADVYLLDDTLSAVDSHVGADIFEHVIGNQGMLAGKTRVLVTHGVQWLPHVDQIVVLRHGRVSEVGSYHQLLSHNGPFASFLRHYLRHAPKCDKTAEVERMQDSLLRQVEALGPGEGQADSEVEGLGESGISLTDTSASSSSNFDDEPVDQDLAVETGDNEPALQDSDDCASSDSPSEDDDDEDGQSWTSGQNEDFKLQHASWGSVREFARSVGYWWVGLLLGLFCLQQFGEWAGSLVLGRWTDDADLANLTALPPDSPERTAGNNRYLAAYAGLSVLYALSAVTFKVVFLMRQVVVGRILHNNMLSRVLRAPMTFFDTTPIGRIIKRFSSDLHVTDTELFNSCEWACYLILSLVGRVAIMAYVSPLFLLMALPFAALFRHVQNLFVPTMRQLENLDSRLKAPVYSFFSESLAGTAVIRAYGAQSRFVREFQRRFDKFAAVHFYWGTLNRWLFVRMETMGNAVVAVVVVFAIVYRHSMSAGMVGLAVSIAMEIAEDVRSLVHMISWFQTELVCVDRIQAFSSMAVEADWRKEETAPRGSWPEAGHIEIKDLSLRYRDDLDLVLRGITVNIKAGEKVGIVGRTGAGKSSLTLSLFRLVEPAGGEVKVDGVVTSDLGLHDLRSRLTILPQDPVIFAGSLRMNLDPFGLHEDEAVREALRHAHLQDFVSGLKEGLDHECGEGGENLSMGQRQLLCLARTLLHRSRVLVLDEATAAVDLETDDLIQRTLRTQFSGCTVLTIAHRLNTVIDYDKILVLDNGEVVEFDTPGNLMSNPASLFHDMTKQAGLLKNKS